MGRALAVSKLESIKSSIGELEKNINTEAGSINTTVKEMLNKHQPSELDPSMIKGLDEKANEIFTQIPKINQLENSLEIQEEDSELAAVKERI